MKRTIQVAKKKAVTGLGLKSKWMIGFLLVCALTFLGTYFIPEAKQEAISIFEKDLGKIKKQNESDTRTTGRQVIVVVYFSATILFKIKEMFFSKPTIVIIKDSE